MFKELKKLKENRAPLKLIRQMQKTKFVEQTWLKESISEIEDRYEEITQNTAQRRDRKYERKKKRLRG